MPKETDIKTLITCLETDMQEYPEHVFRAKWQQQQMGICVDRIGEGSIAMIMDFSENYGCVFQSEVQSGFFDRNQVTIHPIMCYYTEKEGGKKSFNQYFSSQRTYCTNQRKYVLKIN